MSRAPEIGCHAFQSTPAITGGRDRRAASRQARSHRFNPRPPLLAGETVGQRQQQVVQRVSIHARHYWRARHDLDPLASIDALFQSTPAITGGRDQVAAAYANSLGSFNPRPPLLAGETAPQWRQALPRVVSIHARHYWRARLARRHRRDLWRGVSIHARHYWQARPTLTPIWGSTPSGFNPRPPLLAGETRWA